MATAIITHLGYEYSTVYTKEELYNSPSRQDYVVGEREVWSTYRVKPNAANSGTSEEKLLFKEKETQSGISSDTNIYYYNLNKILSSLINEYGQNILLEDLSGYFPSSLADNPITKIFKLGVVDILKSNLHSTDAKKEEAILKSMELLIKDGVNKDNAKDIIDNFAHELGLQIGKVEIETNYYSEDEKRILIAIEWGIEEKVYTLNLLQSITKFKKEKLANVIETLAEKRIVRIETLVEKGFLRKEIKGYIFDYKIFNLNDKKLSSINNLRNDLIKDRVCP